MTVEVGSRRSDAGFGWIWFFSRGLASLALAENAMIAYEVPWKLDGEG